MKTKHANRPRDDVHKERTLMKKIALKRSLVSALLSLAFQAHADPQITSWFTTYSSKYARVYTNDAAKTAGNSAAIWSNGTQIQSSPAYAGVQQVYSSSNWVYLKTSGLAAHTMGPWQNGSF